MTFSDSDGFLDWPLLAELKRWRDMVGDQFDADAFPRELAAAIQIVKIDVGDWDELTDLPDAALGEAAMRMAVLLRANAGESTALLSKDPQYQAALKGHRRRFPIA